MSTEIVIAQDLWEEDEEAVITTWLASAGGQVEAGDTLAEVMVQKIQHEILAPASGTLEILKDADETVSKGDLIGRIA
jgi:pyruvate/2-oxoglutarate dehydrogenase complex dihydrolipoamide acyltransferase (E2) component